MLYTGKKVFVMVRHSNVIIAVFSTSAGIGKTLTAINLAAGFASEGYHTCLVDLDLQFGDVMSYLHLASRRTLYDAQKAVLENPDDFDVMEYLTEYRWGNVAFSVLPPPHNIEDAYRVDVAGVERIIDKLSWFNFIILDITPVFSALNLAMLDKSTVINYIGVIDFFPSIKNYKVGYDTLIRFEYEENKIRLIENRANSQRFVRTEDVEELLGAKFFHRLPNDFNSASHSIRAGQPLMFSDPNSNLQRSFEELVARYTSRSQEGVGDAKSMAKSGFFSRFINRFKDPA